MVLIQSKIGEEMNFTANITLKLRSAKFFTIIFHLQNYVVKHHSQNPPSVSYFCAHIPNLVNSISLRLLMEFYT